MYLGENGLMEDDLHGQFADPVKRFLSLACNITAQVGVCTCKHLAGGVAAQSAPGPVLCKNSFTSSRQLRIIVEQSSLCKNSDALCDGEAPPDRFRTLRSLQDRLTAEDEDPMKPGGNEFLHITGAQFRQRLLFPHPDPLIQLWTPLAPLRMFWVSAIAGTASVCESAAFLQFLCP